MQRRQRQIPPTDLKPKTIGAVVRELRKVVGRSQERLSREYGLDRTARESVVIGLRTRRFLEDDALQMLIRFWFRQRADPPVLTGKSEVGGILVGFKMVKVG